LTKRFDTRLLFDGYPAWLIAEWCCVSQQTAYHWKSGVRIPGKTALRLFMLHKSGRVLTDEWDGWGVHRGKLCDPSGNELEQDQIRAYSFVYQLAQEYGKQNRRADEVLQRLAARRVPKVHVSPKDREMAQSAPVLPVPPEIKQQRADAAKTARRA
jgi:hypothetical protein